MEQREKLLNRFIIKLQGKDFILFEGLLHLAHQEGLRKVKTQVLQIPSMQNDHLAVVQAEVETDKGFFTGLGDASPESVNKNVTPHLIRLAETRALARALRFAINIGMTTVEELGDINLQEIGPNQQLGDNSGEEEIPAQEVIIGFGKYAGKKMGEILEEDRGYLEWLAENARDEQIRKSAKDLVSQLVPS